MQPARFIVSRLFTRFIPFTLMLALLAPLAAPLLAQNALARVIKSRGTVELKRQSDADFSGALAAAMQLFNGDAIRAGDDGFASLIFLDDQSLLKVKENSQIEILETASTRTINMQYGTLRSNLPQPIKGFRVQTPNSVAAVKGTDFWVISDENAGTDQFYGVDGVVEILNIISGLTQNLIAGTMIISTAAGQLTPPIPVSPSQFPDDPDDAIETEPEPGPEPEETPEETGDAGDQTPAEAVPQESVLGNLADQPTVADATVAEPEATTDEEPKAEPESGGGGGPGLGMGLGSVTIDGVSYFQIALRPELAFGKLALGLDVVAYIDPNGEIRKDEWDEPIDYLDKIMYLRWATPQDPFFFQIGAMPSVQYGFGALMDNYSNMAEFPQVRRVGFEIGGNISDRASLRVFAADLKEFRGKGGLVGLRASYKLSKKFPLTLGVNFVTDLNQYGALSDRDGDGAPDLLDDFPDSSAFTLDTDGDGIPDALEIDVDGDQKLEFGVDNNGDGWIDGTEFDSDGDGIIDSGLEFDDDVFRKREPFNIKDRSSSIVGVSFDLSMPIINNKLLSLIAYTEYGVLDYATELVSLGGADTSGTGWGLVGPGIRGKLFGFINASIEYRRTSSLFIPGFFNSNYDFERAQFALTTDSLGQEGITVKTKDQILINNPYGLAGFYGSASASLFNLVTFGAAYQKLSPTTADTTALESNSFLANLSLNTDFIPKISEARAYYIRNNDDNPFAFRKPSANTTWGYRIAYELAPGVDLIYNLQESYRDLNGNGIIDGREERVRLLTMETAFRF